MSEQSIIEGKSQLKELFEIVGKMGCCRCIGIAQEKFPLYPMSLDYISNRYYIRLVYDS